MSDDFLRLLTLRDPNTRIVLLGSALLGLGSGVIGTLAVLRRRALMGDALAHAALPGIWIAFLLLREKSFLGLMYGAALAGAAGVAAITFIRSHSRIKEDAAIGIVLSTFFAAGICLSRIVQSMNVGNSAGLDSFLLGKAASMLPEDVMAIATVCAVVILTVALLFKEFRLLCFDREFAAA
jgi:manganese/zinc/iron transport system permease protein